ncbi:hypothetical protein A4H97_21455 [Niastella yeongjuensis]|uniref:Uncharacterized protein n=1 Tax=Niastella yeongjuensis TaxID=354355 RepID=A0A1V9F808_9BACT|nr:hypothetical protein [Niastella yeongjuensis]OQP54539.1 hypothetical protein A4H97_21455 [Niastella yeongjuensis]SEN98249.1 hypothetical protein SAMN05660816_01804 [Niastella yeongjuensis]
MKNETKEDFRKTLPFTKAVLETLQDKGFQYVQVKGFTSDKRLDYMEPRYLVLIPIKTLPEAPDSIEIYEPINSQLLQEWAAHPHTGMQVFISFNKNKSIE